MQMVATEERATKAEADARIERDWRTSLQQKEIKHKEVINSLQLEINKLSDDLRVSAANPKKSVTDPFLRPQKNERIRSDLEMYKTRWSEAQHTLEELGIQLSVSKLQISEMKEKLENIDKNGGDTTPTWTPDKFSTHCSACSKEFTVTRRKHHCRQCGQIFCGSCSEYVAILPSDPSGKAVRVCNSCFNNLSRR